MQWRSSWTNDAGIKNALTMRRCGHLCSQVGSNSVPTAEQALRSAVTTAITCTAFVAETSVGCAAQITTAREAFAASETRHICVVVATGERITLMRGLYETAVS